MTDDNDPNPMQAEGAWDQMVGAVKKTYGDITDDDIQRAKGNAQKLFGIVEEKTGDAVETIKKKIQG